jgi:hypothetical protein
MIVFDCEIEKAILMSGENMIEGIEYCEGWSDFEGMGLSCICAYDYVDTRSRVFCKDNFDEFQDLVNKADVVIGFNNIGFDNKLCSAHGIKIPEDRSYDLLVHIWIAAGLGPVYQHPTHAGYGLDAVCETNFGIRKTGHGAMAPVDWQRGNIGRVIDYCANDVRMACHLFDYVMSHGYIINPKRPTEKLNMKGPFEEDSMHARTLVMEDG